jgi:hypothetical protein
LHPEAIGHATWLLVFLHSHGVSPLEIFLMAISQSPQFRNEQRFVTHQAAYAPKWNCFTVPQLLANPLGLAISLLRASRRN